MPICRGFLLLSCGNGFLLPLQTLPYQTLCVIQWQSQRLKMEEEITSNIKHSLKNILQTLV